MWDRSTLRLLLRNMEREAQAALAHDASFFEALQALKWEVDSDARVKAAMRGLRDRGLSVFSSFAPRIRILLRAGETLLALPKCEATSHGHDGEDFDHVGQILSATLTQELRDAARAVIAASPYCRELDGIINEAVHANASFERIAAAVERAGYELQICLDLSTYAQVRRRSATPVQVQEHPASPARVPEMGPRSWGESFDLRLSSRDVRFLKQLRINPD